MSCPKSSRSLSKFIILAVLAQTLILLQSKQQRAKKSARPMACKDLSKLSTEVLRLRLQNLNLLITGSCSQLVRNLRAALGSNVATAANEPGRTVVIKPHSGCQRVQHTHTGKNRCIAAEPGVPKPSTSFNPLLAPYNLY